MSNSFRELNRLVEVTYGNFNKVLDFVVDSINSCKEKQLPIVWGDSGYIADTLVGDSGTAHRFTIDAIRATDEADSIKRLEVHTTKIDSVTWDKWVDIDTFDMDTILHMVLYIELPT